MCDLCFMSKCPYVPPHTLNIDFPHLMLRYRAVENMPNNTLGVSLKKPEKYSVDEISGSRISQTVDKSSTHVEEGVSRTLEMKPESTFFITRKGNKFSSRHPDELFLIFFARHYSRYVYSR
jgi:hypothetical protein